MPATPMYRVVQVATGVAGAPYYLTAYFNAEAGTAQQAATAWRTFLGNSPGDYSTPYAYESISTVDTVDPVSGNVLGVTAVSVGSVQFTGTAEPLPPTVQGLIRWRTGIYVNGREVRGRTNLPRATEANSDFGVPNSAYLTARQANISTLLDNATVEHVVYSKLNGRWEATLTGSPWNQWSVLRSRRD